MLGTVCIVELLALCRCWCMSTNSLMMSWRHERQWEQTRCRWCCHRQQLHAAAACVCAPTTSSVFEGRRLLQFPPFSSVSHSKPRSSEGPVGLHVAIATSQRQRWLGHDVCRQPDMRMLSGFTVRTWRRVSKLLFTVLLFRKLNWERNLRYYSNTDLSVNNIFYSDISFY